MSPPHSWLPLDEKSGRCIAARLYGRGGGTGTEMRVFCEGGEEGRPREAGVKFKGRLYYADASPRHGLAVAVTDDTDLDRSTFYVYKLHDVTGLNGGYPESQPEKGATVSGLIKCLNIDDGAGRVLIGTEEGVVQLWDVLGDTPEVLRRVDLECGPVKNIITRRTGHMSSVSYGFFTEHKDSQERATLTRDNTDKLCYVSSAFQKECEVRHGLQSHTADYQGGRLLVFGVRGWEDRGEYKEEVRSGGF